MASFEDINRIVSPAPNMSEVVSFVPKPDIPFNPDKPAEPTLGIGEVYAREVEKALSKSTGGTLDLLLAAKGVVAGGFLEVLQTDYEHMQERGESLLNPDSTFATLSSMSVDWKGVVLAAGVYALSSGSRRASKPYTVERDMVKALQKAQRIGAEITPHTETSYRRYRRVRRAGQFAGTVAATGLAYGVGQHLSLEANLIGGAVATSAGALRATRARNKFMRRFI